MLWGVLGPGSLHVERRTRGLGLGGAVRYFNEVAVPGMGGVWFAKPLFLSLLGIRIAEDKDSGVPKITAANAVEALACCLAFERNGWKRDDHLVGRRKLAGVDALTFKVLGRVGTYVPQPMRMATTSALPALGLVEPGASRFNTMCLSDVGHLFLQAASKNHRPYNTELINYLCDWQKGRSKPPENSDKLADVLSPLLPLPREALDILSHQVFGFDTDVSRRNVSRRCAVRDWLSAGAGEEWTSRPACISPEHWLELEAGARFFALRETCLALLDGIEDQIGSRNGHFDPAAALPEPIETQIHEVKRRAKAFLDIQLPGADSGVSSARELADVLNGDPETSLVALVERDGRTLTTDGRLIRPGPVFRGNATGRDEMPQSEEPGEMVEEEGDSVPHNAAELPPLPAHISPRIGNFFNMINDLKSQGKNAHG
ncbi:hypothetical protein [Roseixanthobacter liquoris]|uniref:hypothetical protein n=1 Tax=Roseixanthobacter liquoris TaxID=3119921 RepID=UPI0037284BF6